MGTPAQNFAGPPRVVRLKHHVSLSKLLSLTFVFANYPLRTKLVRLKTTLSNKKILHKRRTFLLAGVAGFEPTNDDTKNRCLTTWRHPNNILCSHLSHWWLDCAPASHCASFADCSRPPRYSRRPTANYFAILVSQTKQITKPKLFSLPLGDTPTFGFLF